MQALRDVGAIIDISTGLDSTGDWCIVSPRKGSVARVGREEGLRGQLAEMTAIDRMLAQVPGLEMPD